MGKETFKTSAAVRRANAKYDSKFDKAIVRLQPGTLKRIQALGYKSLNAFMVMAIMEKLEREEQMLGKKKTQ